MEIIALGHSGFRLRGKEVTLVIDPPSPATGYSLKGVTADIVCVTHNHPGHNYVQGIGGKPYLVNGPGEYEIGGVLITALRTFHDDKRGEARGGNTVFIIHMEDVAICHLGDLGHALNATQQQEAGGADVLMIPVGGQSTINAATAVELVGELEPSITIPMHYGVGHDAGRATPLDPVDVFYHALGVPIPDPLPKLVVTRTSIPTEPQVVILAPKG
jgi:L-ascorbate metabolism protein UlaG (beta-lactamase superfamily)